MCDGVPESIEHEKLKSHIAGFDEKACSAGPSTLVLDLRETFATCGL